MLRVISPSILRPAAAWMAPPPTYYVDFLGAQTGGLTVTRSGATATYVGADGSRATAAANAQRIDHDPVTLARTGLMREPARTNLVLYSDDASNANWFKDNVTIDGTGAVVENSATSAHAITQSFTLTGNAVYTASAECKESGRRYVQALADPGDATNFRWAMFDLQNGTVTDEGAGVTATIRAAPGGYWLCSIVYTTAAVPSAPYVSWHASDAATGFYPSYEGSGEEAFLIRGIQLEAGHCPTSRIATTSATVSRNADAIGLSGAPFNQIWNAAEGTALVEWSMLDAPAGSAFPPLLSFNDGGGNERINLFLSEASDGFFLGCVDGGAAQVTGMTVPGAAYDGTVQRIAGAWKLNTIRMAAMGTLSALDTSATIPTVTQMQVGDQASALGPASTPVWFRRIAYWGVRLPDEVLVALTR